MATKYYILEEISPTMQVQHDCSDILSPFFTSDGLIVNSLDFAMKLVSSFYNF